MAEPIPPSAQSSSYSLTTLSSHVSTDRRAVTDMNGKTRTLHCAPFLCRLRRRECCMLGATSNQPTVPLHALPPAMLVIHRQTSAHERRKWTRSVQSRSGILAYLCTRQHWLWITVDLHIPGARHGEAVAREGGRYDPVRRVLGSRPLSLRPHRRRGGSRPLRSAVVEYQAPSVAGLTPTLREDWSCKRALETPCHARIATSPQDPTAMSPDHWSNFWSISAGGHDL